MAEAAEPGSESGQEAVQNPGDGHGRVRPPRDGPETGPVRRSSAREMQQVQRAQSARVSRETLDAPLEMRSWGYGFGLGVMQDCKFRRVVGHGGGLPGFSSNMRWLPEHGVGIVVLSNLTYAGWTETLLNAFSILAQTGALQPRVPQPAAALLKASEGIRQLITRWDDALADELVADSLFLDKSREQRRNELEELRTKHGTCELDGEIKAKNALRGHWIMSCERGQLRVSITLAPTAPPRVQFLKLKSALPLSEPLEKSVASLSAMITAGKIGASNEIIDLGKDLDSFRAQLSAAAAWGACRDGDVLKCDGSKHVEVRFECDRGDLDVTLDLDAESGRMTSVKLAPSSKDTCVP